MVKELIKQTFNGDITIVEGVKRLTGVQVTDHFDITDEDGDVLHKKTVRNATQEELTLLLGDETATLKTANATLNNQNTALQDALAAANDLAEKRLAALQRVANADNEWDESVRKYVVAAMPE